MQTLETLKNLLDKYSFIEDAQLDYNNERFKNLTFFHKDLKYQIFNEEGRFLLRVNNNLFIKFDKLNVNYGFLLFKDNDDNTIMSLFDI